MGSASSVIKSLVGSVRTERSNPSNEDESLMVAVGETTNGPCAVACSAQRKSEIYAWKILFSTSIKGGLWATRMGGRKKLVGKNKV